METYVPDRLRQGIICPSTFPITAGFFFFRKKDGGLCPCIDYRALYSTTVKWREFLPLIPSALEQLCNAAFFTELDLGSGLQPHYNMQRG